MVFDRPLAVLAVGELLLAPFPFGSVDRLQSHVRVVLHGAQGRNGHAGDDQSKPKGSRNAFMHSSPNGLSDHAKLCRDA